MSLFPHWEKKISERRQTQTLRSLSNEQAPVDFLSNDYLGLARNGADFLKNFNLSELKFGSGGSRLLGGNSPEHEKLESFLAQFHGSESALLFNSGYDANTGLISTLPHRHDVILYDKAIHASMREGIRLSGCKAYSFYHNDTHNLEQLLQKHWHPERRVFVLTESLFSMDGDRPDLSALIGLIKKYDAFLFLDEAHAVGVTGREGQGLYEAGQYPPNEKVFRIITFGKAVGVCGAAVLVPAEVKEILVNFCKPFIYSTALPPVMIEAIRQAYLKMKFMDGERHHLAILQSVLKEYQADLPLIGGKGGIAGIVTGNPISARRTATALREEGFDVRPVSAPTVEAGTERIRICLHAYNSETEVRTLAERAVFHLKRC